MDLNCVEWEWKRQLLPAEKHHFNSIEKRNEHFWKRLICPRERIWFWAVKNETNIIVESWVREALTGVLNGTRAEILKRDPQRFDLFLFHLLCRLQPHSGIFADRLKAIEGRYGSVARRELTRELNNNGP